MTRMKFQFGQVARNSGFRMDDYWVFCPSIVKGEDGRWHMFASRWPKWLPFHPGWLTNSEVVRAAADNLAGPYTFQEVVLPPRGAEWWDGRSTFNPTLRKHGDTYYLFYVGTTHPFPDVVQNRAFGPFDPQNLREGALDRIAAMTFGLFDPRAIVGRSNKRIGLATSHSVFGPWKRMDDPILATKPGTFYSHLTSNPAPCLLADGTVMLMFKARKYEGYNPGEMVIGIARAERPEGPYTVLTDEPIFNRFGMLEDPFLWHDAHGFHAVIKEFTGKISGQGWASIYARSADGKRWDLGDPPTAFKRDIVWDDGMPQTMGCLDRPFLFFDETGAATHLFAGTCPGPGNFCDAAEVWDICIPIIRPESN